ncbi:MAG: hypothetical protein F4210_00345 [Holophagales bacterium]|nr:hypothetical protein [Holophagales bacterium]MYB19747.1 hypothetical protein [Holophagales bacterium]MYF93968.1 hypothetical protein [Holophagales bacterium]MYH24233.1 hypothetical protein [Holophagales bacterium]
MNEFNPLWITVAIGVVGAVATVGVWIGHVNSDRKNFKAFMAEVREDIKTILRHLEPDGT